MADIKTPADDIEIKVEPQNSGAFAADATGTDSDGEVRIRAGENQVQKITRSLKQGSDKLASDAADKAKGFLHQGLERTAELLGNVSRMVGETAGGIDDRLGEEYGDYARKASDALSKASTSLANKDADEVVEDTRQFVKKSPGVALAGAAVVGFVIARIVKSGLSSLEDKNED